MIRERVVAVRHLPESFAYKEIPAFVSDLKQCLDVDRPRLVLDCSQLATVNKQIVHMLLDCLEMAMKRNGDVRLAALSQEAKNALKATDADGLFSTFDTTVDAVASFHPRFRALPLRDTIVRDIDTAAVSE